MIDTLGLLVSSSSLDPVQSASHVNHLEGELIYLVGEGRLLCDCICTALQRADRIVQGGCFTLGDLGRKVDCLVRPDLVIVSLRQSDSVSAFAALQSIRARWPQTRWIVLSRFADHEFIRKGLKSGVDGFLLEDSPVELLRLVTDLVLLGHSPLPIDVARVLADELGPHEPNQAERAAPNIGQHAKEDDDCVGPIAPLGRRSRELSKREQEILRCLSRGMSNKVIARELVIAEATVKAHVKALLRKMQVSNRTQAAICATGVLGPQSHRPSSSLLFNDAAPVLEVTSVMANRSKLHSAAGP